MTLELILLLLTTSSFNSAAPRDTSIAFDEKSTYLEADILPDKVEEQNRMAVRDNHRLWPGGDLLYQMDFDTDSNIFVRDMILSAVDQINSASCVTLTSASRTAVNYVSIRLGTDYSSNMGRQGGGQNLTVVANNINAGTVMHEFMHALGFGHEHNRPDRDDYVVINFDNIQESAKPYFIKYTLNDPVEDQNLPYDYTSLMHATDMHDSEVNIDISESVIWRTDGGKELGQRTILTEVDKQRLKEIYSCDVCKPDSANDRLFRYPGDCNKFIQCSNTFAYVMDCPAGLHFSHKLSICDYPHQANCTTLLDL